MLPPSRDLPPLWSYLGTGKLSLLRAALARLLLKYLLLNYEPNRLHQNRRVFHMY